VSAHFIVNTEKVAHKAKTILNILQREVLQHMEHKGLQMLLTGDKFYLLIISVLNKVSNNLKKILSKCVRFIRVSGRVLVMNLKYGFKMQTNDAVVHIVVRILDIF
jgi:hypothetical protein